MLIWPTNSPGRGEEEWRRGGGEERRRGRVKEKPGQEREGTVLLHSYRSRLIQSHPVRFVCEGGSTDVRS